MTAQEVLDEAIDSGIYLFVEDDKLKFRAPPNSLTNSLKEKLKLFKDDIVVLLKGEVNAAQQKSLPKIEPVSRNSGNVFKLSFAQQRLWFLNQYVGPNSVFNMPMALRLRGEVNITALQRSLEFIVGRHESLRTRFEAHEDGAIQVITHDPFHVAIESVNSATEIQKIGLSEKEYLFDLAEDALCRIRLIKDISNENAEISYLLLVTMHHSISDGWSLGIFFRELVAFYQAFKNDQSPALPPLHIQYVDYASWQRKWMQGDFLTKQLNYWREQLSGAPSLLELPTDRPRPGEQTFNGNYEAVLLPKALQDSLQKISRQQSVTLFMTLISGFAVLLGRYSGQKDLVIGTPIANRDRKETENLIGFFINSLAIRCDLRGNPGFIELLQRTRKIAFEAYANQDIPFEQLVEKLNPERSLAYSPVFQVSFSLINTPMDPVTLGELQMTPEQFSGTNDKGISRYDITFNLSETAAGLHGGMEYNSDLFDRQTIVRMLSHYEALLNSIVEQPETDIWQLAFLSTEEKNQQLKISSETYPDYPKNSLVHDAFEIKARDQADAIAIVHGAQHLTYGELNKRANKIARYLIGIGVGPDVTVGICVERSLEMVIGLLAICKAGGCYVPLDPGYPAARLETMLARSNCRVVLSETHLLDELGFLSEIRTLPLDAEMHDVLFSKYPA